MQTQFCLLIWMISLHSELRIYSPERYSREYTNLYVSNCACIYCDWECNLAIIFLVSCINFIEKNFHVLYFHFVSIYIINI